MDQPLPPLRAVETELKFALAGRFATGVMQHPLIERSATGEPRSERLLSVYYDTPQLDLCAAGVALRLRKTPDGWVQTIKWGGSVLGGLHERAEVESSVPEQQLDLAVLDRTEVATLFAPARVRRRLKPRFVTDFERMNRTLTLGESRIALSFDRGEVVAGSSREPISELELELIGGETAALFDVAAQLQEQFPLRPLSRSKAERGYALSGHADAPHKAAAVTLDPEATVGQSLAIILGCGLAQLQANEHGLLAGGESEYLHQMRVAVRRLRSGLSAHRDVAGGETFDMLRRELKWAGTRLGVARDWDVFAADLLPPLVRERGSDPGLQSLVQAAAAAREKANRSARAAVRSRRYARLVFALGRVAAGGGDVGTDPRCAVPVLPFARGLLDKRHDDVVARGAKLARRSTAELHALRIAIKKLRYAGEFFGSLFGQERAKLFRSRVAKLQESLGVINDQATMLKLTHVAMPRRSPALESLVGGWSARVVHDERERLKDAWQQFRRTRKFW